MKQPGRREFLRLMAAAASGSALEVLLKQAASQPLASEQPRHPQVQTKPFKIGLISDLNSSYGSTSYGPTVERGVNLLLQQKPDLVICAGDMVAGQKTSLTDRQLAAMWEGFETSVRRPCRKPAFHFCRRWEITTPQASDRRAAGSMHGASAAHQFWNRHQDALPPELTEADNFPFQYSLAWTWSFLVVMDASSATVSSALSGNGSPAR